MKYLCYPVNMQVGRLVGRCFGLMFDVDDHQCRGGSFPAHRFPREKRKADGWGRVDLTAGGYMVGQFAFGFSAFLLSDTEALSVERRTVGLRFRRFLRGAIHKLRYATFFLPPPRYADSEFYPCVEIPPPLSRNAIYGWRPATVM